MGFKARQRVVTVYFEDISTAQGWHPLGENDRTLECAVTGFLIDRNNELVRVAHCVSEDELLVADVTSVPTGCVRRIEYYRSRR